MTTAERNELKANIEAVAKEQGKSAVEVISEAQAGAAIVNDEAMLDALCDIKWDYFTA